jgi:hypothetical protein
MDDPEQVQNFNVRVCVHNRAVEQVLSRAVLVRSDQ